MNSKEVNDLVAGATGRSGRSTSREGYDALNRMFDVMAKEIGLVGRFTPSYMTVLPPECDPIYRPRASQDTEQEE